VIITVIITVSHTLQCWREFSAVPPVVRRSLWVSDEPVNGRTSVSGSFSSSDSKDTDVLSSGASVDSIASPSPNGALTALEAAADAAQAAREQAANFVATQLAAFVREGLTGPQVGRVGWVRFGRGTAVPSAPTRGKPDTAASRVDSVSNTADDATGRSGSRRGGTNIDGHDSSSSTLEAGPWAPSAVMCGVAASGLCRSSLSRDAGAGGGAGFGADVVRDYLRAFTANQERQKEGAAVKVFSHGACMPPSMCFGVGGGRRLRDTLGPCSRFMHIKSLLKSLGTEGTPSQYHHLFACRRIQQL
jgi:hypothetical protein